MIALPSSNSSITGANAGFLWKMDEGSSVYLTNPHGKCSPFSNEKFVESFEKAQTIAFRCSWSPKEDIKEPASPPRMKNLVKFAKQTEEYISESKLNEYLSKLEQLIQKMPRAKEVKFPEIDNPRMRFIAKLFVFLFCKSFPEEVQDFYGEILLKANEAKKEIIYLTSKDKEQKYFINTLKYLFKSPAFYIVIEHVFLSEEGMNKWQDIFAARARAWDLGFSSVAEQLPLISSEDAKQLDKIFLDKVGKNKHKFQNNLSCSHLTKYHSDDKIRGIKFSGKIVEQFQKHPSLMLIDSQGANEDLFENLSLLGVQITGPLRESMKPIGFLWEILKADKVVGRFLGSIHIVPNWILENFNSRTLEAFDCCDVLGVEVDITREDVTSALKTTLMDVFFPGHHTDSTTHRVLQRIVEEGLKVHEIEWDKTDPEFLQKGFKLLWNAIASKFGATSGIDHFFIKLAKEHQIPIVDLESIDIHQEYGDLRKNEKKRSMFAWSYEELKKVFEKQICGSNAEILEMGFIQLLEDPSQAEEEKQMMARRNMQMAMTTDRLIREGKTPFSIAGAGHFTGPSSIPTFMRQMGYKVQQVICEEPRT